MFLLLSALSGPTKAEVLTTIKPVHSIVSSLLSEVASPSLLIDKNLAHHFLLTPSQVRKIHQAKLIIAIDKKFEQTLSKVLFEMPKQKVVFLSQSPSLTLIKDNFHLWLSVDNMVLAAGYIAQKLEQIYPNHTDKVQQNLSKLRQALNKQKNNIKQKLMPFKDGQILALSNAYQYFTQDFFTKPNVITNYQHEHKITLSQIYQLRTQIKNNVSDNPACLLGENRQKNVKVARLLNAKKLNTANLDPLGNHLDSGVQHYPKLLDELMQKLSLCLQ